MNDDTRFNDTSVGAALDLLSPSEVPSPTLAWARQRALYAQPPQGNPLTTSWRSLMSALSRTFAVARRPVRDASGHRGADGGGHGLAAQCLHVSPWPPGAAPEPAL